MGFVTSVKRKEEAVEGFYTYSRVLSVLGLLLFYGLFDPQPASVWGVQHLVVFSVVGVVFFVGSFLKRLVEFEEGVPDSVALKNSAAYVSLGGVPVGCFFAGWMVAPQSAGYWTKLAILGVVFIVLTFAVDYVQKNMIHSPEEVGQDSSY